MTITNRQSGTNVHDVTDEIYHIDTPLLYEGGLVFSFNQYFIADELPAKTPIS